MGEPTIPELDSPTVERRPCLKCGCPLALVPGPNGKTIPLDLRSPVYVVTKDLLNNAAAHRTQGYVSHFSTCPSANAFGASKKR